MDSLYLFEIKVLLEAHHERPLQDSEDLAWRDGKAQTFPPASVSSPSTYLA